MGKFTAGSVILARFPFSNLEESKLRPALVLATVEYGDLLLCQITSKHYGDRFAVPLEKDDFLWGSLPVTSYLRPGRIATVTPNLVAKTLGQISSSKHDELRAAISRIIA